VKPTISSKFVMPLRRVYVRILFLCIIIEKKNPWESCNVYNKDILHLGFTRSRKR
jgi:hypothetical protein